MTGDETRNSYSLSETIDQSINRVEEDWFAKTKEIQKTFHGIKLKATVFWDRKGVLLVALMNPEATITSKVYCEILKQLRRAIPDRWHGLLTLGVMLLHEHTQPLTAV